MGLAVSHNCFVGSYTKFHEFRKWLAFRAHIPFDLMEGQFSLKENEAIAEKFEDSLPLSYEGFKPDIIHALLKHSDCSGELPWYICDRLAERLIEIKAGISMPHESELRFIEILDNFVIGLGLAYSNKEDVLFM